MRQLQFDPYGEPVAPDLRAAVEAGTRVGALSRVAMRTGVVVFWTLVAVIVAARAAYFDPDFARHFGSVAVLGHTLKALIGT